MMVKIYLFIKRNRLRKKWKLIKQFISLTVDFTTLFYAFILIAYFMYALISEGSYQFQFFKTIGQIELIAHDYVWYIVTIIPIARLIQAFQSPGVLFSSAEYQLTVLPYSRSKVWFTVAVERWMKALFTYIFIGAVIYIFTPISLTTISLYGLIFLLLNITLTPIEWKFFQLSVYEKISIFIVLIVINGLAFMISSPLFAALFMVLIIICNVFLMNRLFDEIDWQKVTAANDYKLWRSLIISYATKMKFKKDRKYSIWQRMPFWKKPFPYQKETLYHRLWHLYLEKNISHIFQLVGALLLMLFVFSFLKEWLFLLAVIATIHIYTSFAVTLFKDRLASDIVQVLPWDMNVFKATFEQWILVSSTVFFIPLFTKTIGEFTLWSVVMWFVIMFTFYILLHLKLYRVLMELDHTYPKQDMLYVIGYGLLLMIFISDQFPIVLIFGSVVAVGTTYYIKMKKHLT